MVTLKDGCQADSVFSGISTFGRLPYQPCLSRKDVTYDIAFIGMRPLTRCGRGSRAELRLNS